MSVTKTARFVTSAEVQVDYRRYNSVLAFETSKKPWKGLKMHSDHSKSSFEIRYQGLEGFREKTKSELEGLYRALTELGTHVHLGPRLKGPDCHYAMDLGLALNGRRNPTLYLSNMGSSARQVDNPLASKYLDSLHIPHTALFTKKKKWRRNWEGGDLLKIETLDGRRLLCIGKRIGDSSNPVRTTKGGRKLLRTLAGTHGYSALTIEHSMLHLSSSMGLLGQPNNNPSSPIYFSVNNTAIKNAEGVRQEIAARLQLPFNKIRFVYTPKGERWAAGSLGINGEIIVLDTAEKFIQTLEKIGFRVRPLPGDALRDCDGSWHCGILDGFDSFKSLTAWKE